MALTKRLLENPYGKNEGEEYFPKPRPPKKSGWGPLHSIQHGFLFQYDYSIHQVKNNSDHLKSQFEVSFIDELCIKVLYLESKISNRKYSTGVHDLFCHRVVLKSAVYVRLLWLKNAFTFPKYLGKFPSLEGLFLHVYICVCLCIA